MVLNEAKRNGMSLPLPFAFDIPYQLVSIVRVHNVGEILHLDIERKAQEIAP